MNKDNPMSSIPGKTVGRRALLSLGVAALCSALAVASAAAPQAEQKTPAPAPAAQKAFDTPQQAVEALIQAADRYDVPALLEIFGPEGKDFLPTADPVQDKNTVEAFAAKAREKNAVNLDPKSSKRAILTVGAQDWPFPVPLVKKGGKWYFDSKEGHDEILFRRIGGNELDAIQICRGFVEAQYEYALMARELTGISQYAQKIISTPGKKDGLYWVNADGTPGGPISEAVARAIEEGYSANSGSGYHGYYYKVLKGQGPAAPLGELDYVIEGVMIGGFALVAVPAEYRVTGVKTFMVSYDGIVYEQDLGPDSLKIFKAMERYNPDKTWKRTDDDWSMVSDTTK
jgi:Protein of unknown function (DUF2950)